MAAASSKDIQDLTKAIQSLISTAGSSKSTSSSKRPSTTSAGLSEKQLSAGFGGLEARDEQRKKEEEFRKRLEDYDKKAIDASKQLLDNQKAWGTELYKSLDLTEEINSVAEDIYDINEKYLAAKRKNNKETEKELQITLKVLKNKKYNLQVQQENAKKQEIANKLAEKQLTTFKKITDAIKNPIHALESLGEKMSESMGTRFNASLAAPKKSLKEIAVSGLKFGVVAALATGVKRAFEMNTELVHMQRNLGISKKASHDIHHDLQDAAISSKVLGATSADYSEAFSTLTAAYGTAAGRNAELLDSQVLLTKQIGMTNDQALAFQGITASTGETAEYNLGVIQEQVEGFNKITGSSIAVRDVQKEIANISKTTFASYKGNVTQLSRAVLKAKQLGMTMDETSQISENLLSIETSIENEMKANVLTGKHMNMNAARALALQGDSVGAAAAAVKEVGSYDEFLKMNVIQQKAVAEAAGMTVEQIVKAGNEEKRRNIMGEKTFRQLTEQDKEKLISQKLYDKNQLKSLALEEQAADVKERMVQLADKLMTTFDLLVTNSIEPLVDGLGKAFTFISDSYSKTKEFLKSGMPKWVINLIKGTGTIAKAGIGIVVGFQLIKKLGGILSNFFRGKHGETKAKPMYTQEVSGSDKGSAKGLLGSLSPRNWVKNLGDKFKSFSAAKKAGGMRGAIKSLFTKENAVDAVTSAATGTAPIGSANDPIYVRIIGGIGGGAAGGGGGGGLMDSLSEVATGMEGSDVGGGASSTGGQRTKKDGTPDKRYKSNRTTAAAASAAGGGAKKGFFGKIGGFFEKINPAGSIKKVFGDKGFVSKILGKMPKVGTLISMATSLYALGSGAMNASGAGSYQDVGKQMLMSIGDLGGSFLGGLLGSLGGPAAIAGTILGGMAGSSLAEYISGFVDLSGLGKMVVDILGPGGGSAAAQPVSDALIRPGMPPIAFDKGDLILAGTNLLGGQSSTTSNNQGSLSEVTSLLKELIIKVEQPVKFNISGRVIDELESQASLRRSYNTKIDGAYGANG